MRKFIFGFIFIIISSNSFATDNVWTSIYNFFIPHHAQQQLLFKTETKYFNIEVRENHQGLRQLIFLPYLGAQSIWDPKHPKKVFSPSLKTLCATLAVSDQMPKQYLFLGMGAGIMPRFIHRHFPAAKIDIVELDPAIPRIAEQYFGFKPNSQTTIITADARVYINKCTKHYDVIIVDVYNAKMVPFQVTTEEFFSRLKACLKPQGIAGVNLANLGNRQFLASELFTIGQIFNNLVIYACPGESNFIPIFSPSRPIMSTNIASRVREIEKQYKFEFSLSAWLKRCTIINDVHRYFALKPVFITDDFAF